MTALNSRVYRTKVGALEVMLLSDGYGFFNPYHPVIGGNQPADVVEAGCRDWAMPEDGYTACVAMLVRTPDRTVLIDVGSGDTFSPTTGELPNALAEAGVDPKSVDTILLTHAHPDHLGGLQTKSGDDQYPNAEIYISDIERDFWMNNPDLSRATMPDERKTEFIAVAQDRLKRFADRMKSAPTRGEVVPGIESVETFGHTPGHLSFRVRNGGESLIFVGDAIFFTPVLPMNPSWHCALDTDPEAAKVARDKLMAMLADGNERFAATHIALPSLGRFRRQGDGYLFLPEPWREDRPT